MRFLCAPRRWLFFKAPLNLVDLLAILPYFVSFVMEELKVRLLLKKYSFVNSAFLCIPSILVPNGYLISFFQLTTMPHVVGLNIKSAVSSFFTQMENCPSLLKAEKLKKL